jgi:sulfatase modifying factor 1
LLLYVDYVGDPDGSDGFPLIAPPGRYTWGASPYGARDMAGNVAEWTLDLWALDDTKRGYDNLEPKLARWESIGHINPVREGPSNQPHVVRGGSWRQPAWLGRTNLRDPYNILYDGDHRFSHIGFRCARPGN